MFKKFILVLFELIGVLAIPYDRITRNKRFQFLMINSYTYRVKGLFGYFGDESFIAGDLTTRNSKNIFIGKRTRIWKHSVINIWKSDDYPSPRLIIGNGCSFGEYNHITAANKIDIGDNVLTGRWVTITDNAHGKSCSDELHIAPESRKIFSKGPVKIGNNVWIGDKCTILPGVTIGSNTIIAANSVVTTSFPNNCVIAGVPAKLIKTIK